MALTTVSANNRGLKFITETVNEFIRGDMFKKYKSESPTAIIRVIMLKGKYGGDQVNLPIITALQSGGVGSGPLEGNEEKIGDSGMRLWIDWKRNAVRATKSAIKRGSFDIFAEAKPRLVEWGQRIQRDETVLAYLAIPSENTPVGLGGDLGRTVNGVLWSEATAAQRNQWLTDNNDRVWFGGLRSNTVAGNVASSLANITAANGKMSGALVRRMKAAAKKTSPRIAPVTTDDGYERYVMFVGSNAFRDAQADPEIYNANKDARPREGTAYKQNPIFNDGDLLYNGVVIREVPEIDTLLTLFGAGNGGTVGTSSAADVAPVFLCGQNSLAWVWSEEIEPTQLDDTDYQFHKGVGIEMSYGVAKVAARTTVGSPTGVSRFADWGVSTGFVNSSPDV